MAREISRYTPTETITHLRSRLAGIRHHSDAQATKVQRLAVGFVAAFGYGAWGKSRQATGQALPTVAGINPLLVGSVAGYVAGSFIGGRTGEVMQDAGLGLLNAYGFLLGSGSANQLLASVPGQAGQ